MKALDLFAGTGWGVACQWLGIEEDGVEIMPEAVATREANGMKTIYRDVWDGLELSRAEFACRYGTYEIGISSPPCQTFSIAGNGKGRRALNHVLEAIETEAYKDVEKLRAFGEEHDPRTALVLTPLAYAVRDLPQYVVFEQVPPVLPVWEACGEVLRAHGYSVVTGILSAEQYGVPQTRRRAILIARRDGVEAKMPTPTHSKYYPRDPKRFDEGVLPWVSMAEALGWGRTDAPSHTITGGASHGPDRWASGGSSVRKVLDEKIGGPDWKPREGNSEPVGKETYVERFGIDEVAALQSYPKFRTGHRPNASERPITHPAPTIIAGNDTENRGFTDDSERGVRTATPAEVAALQSYPTHMSPAGTASTIIDPRPVTHPAHTITGAGTAQFGDRPTRAPEAKAADPSGRWATPDEAAALQSYPPKPFVWCGAKGKQNLQIGNAVPPLLAKAILSVFLEEV